MFSIFSNLGILFTFKYFNFFIDSAKELLDVLGFSVRDIYLELALPVGISFYTFQTMSYSIDVYRGRIAPEKNFGIFALYVSYFPQLLAGPIERAENLLPQFKNKSVLTLKEVQFSLNIIAYGIFKKVVVADRLSLYVDNVYEDLSVANPIAILSGAFLFGIQVYCDFSGYSHIARGLSQLLGIKLLRNFDRPFLAHSVRDYWRRWHVSLSNWIRDYLYIPMGGSRVKPVRTLINLVTVFVVMGLWHGANWSLAVWGATHGLGLSIERFFRNKFHFLPLAFRNTVGSLFTLCFVFIGFIMYRADNVQQGFAGYMNLLEGDWDFSMKIVQAGLTIFQFKLCLISLVLLGLSYLCPKEMVFTGKKSLVYNFISLLIMAFIIILFSTNDDIKFIYFQF